MSITKTVINNIFHNIPSFVKKYSGLFAVLLLAGMFFLEFTSALQESQTVDEGAHLSAGYSYIKTGDFRLNPEHPPLIKELSAIPLLMLNLDIPTDSDAWNNYNQWDFGRSFIYHNNTDADLIMLLGRLPVMLLSLILGLLIFKWTKKLWGANTALITLVFYVFEPNILAHSRYITTDIGITFFIFLALYAFSHYLTNSSNKMLALTAAAFALAQLAKFSAVILLPILIVFFILKRWHSSDARLSLKKLLIFIGVTLGVTAVAVFCIYGFEIKKPINDQEINNYFEKQLKVTDLNEFSDQPSLVRNLRIFTHPSTASGKVVYYLARNLPVPAFSYFKGFYSLAAHDYWGHRSYLAGNYSETGFWYYFPFTFLAKTPLPMLLLFIFGLVYFIFKLVRRYRLTAITSSNSANFASARDKKIILFLENYFIRAEKTFRSIPFHYWILILTPAVYFLWSLTSKINIGHRHILPVYPFLIMLASRMLTIQPKRYEKYWKSLSVFLVATYIASAIAIYPYFLAYSNEIFGGPKNGPKYLVDSNIDWGQDIIRLKNYVEQNGIKDFNFTYFGSLDLGYYQLGSIGPVPKDGNYLASVSNFNNVAAISVTVLYEKDRPYQWLEKLEPTARIGYSIYVYDLRKK